MALMKARPKTPSETAIHWIIDRPSLTVICEEGTPTPTNVVTRVQFRHSLYRSYNTNMPLFKSGSGGTADNAGASAKSEDEVSKGTKKQDAEEGTTGGALPLSCDEKSRETSPRRNPPEDTRKRDKYTLLISVQLIDIERAGSCMLPHYAWNPTVIKDILSPDIEGISDVIVISPWNVWCSPDSALVAKGSVRRRP